MRSTDIRNCGGDDQIVKVLPNSTIFVNKKCEVISNICTEVKPFSRASVRSPAKLLSYALFTSLGSPKNPKEYTYNPEYNTPSL